MKSNLLVVILFIFVWPNSSIAQNKLGFKLGLNLSDIKYGFEDPYQNPFNPEVYTGVAVGCEISWPFIWKTHLITGIEYSAKGRKDYATNFGTNGPRNLTMQYLSVPLSIELPIWRRLTLRTGIEVNYLVKISHNLIYDLRHLDYGPRLELGWTQQNLRFAVAGYHGARPFFGNPLSEPNFGMTMKNLQFSVAYIIREKTE